jgi:hypothetical protein
MRVTRRPCKQTGHRPPGWRVSRKERQGRDSDEGFEEHDAATTQPTRREFEK